MPKVIRPSDEAQFHGYLPLCQPAYGSPDVITNMQQTVRDTDPYTPSVHCTPPIPVCHGVGTAVQGSPNVFVNNLAIHRDGDFIGCGTVADNGSSNVLANSKDGTWSDERGGDPDTGGDTAGDTGGFVPGRPVVEYAPIVKGSNYDDDGANKTFTRHYVDVLPIGGAGYTPIYDEFMNEYRNYDGIGLVGYIPPGMPPVYEAPIDLVYETYVNGSTYIGDGLALDGDTGRIYGCPGWPYAQVRARHFLFDDGYSQFWPLQFTYDDNTTNPKC